MRVLLDTCIFIEAYEKGIDDMPRKARQTLSEAELLLSAVSLVEVAIKASIGKLHFPPKAVRRAIDDMRLAVLPYTGAHAHRLFKLPLREDHRDPFDRMLIASALDEKLPIVTSDGKFRGYKGLRVIWK